MKTFKITLTTLCIILITSVNTFAQVRGNGNVTKEERQVASFDAINVGCAINLFLSQGETQSVMVETDENLQDKINTKVANGMLKLDCNNVRNATKMNVYVTAVKLSKLNAEGAAEVEGKTAVNADNFSLITSGASKVKLDINAMSVYNEASGASKETLLINAKQLKSEISGASVVKFTGSVTEHKTEVSGAAVLKAMEFVTDNTFAEVSGAANASLMAKKMIRANLSGASSITYLDNSEVKKISKSGEYQLSFNGMDSIKTVTIDADEQDHAATEGEDTVVAKTDENGNVEVILKNNKVVVVTDDSVKVNLGNNSLEIDEDGDIKLKHHNKKHKFNGHWQGLELGVNGYMTPNNDFEYGSKNGYNLLDQKYQKSINVNLNFFEQNVNLIQNHLGLVTGLGFSWNNYRFEDDVRLAKQNGMMTCYTDTNNYSYEKSKLVNTYLTLPLMLEYQTNRYSKVNSFHVSAGVLGGLRIGTHAKYVYDNGARMKDKDHSDFYMNPFKLDAIAKVGWGVINLYATYSLTPMFQKNKGPELYPFAVGICLTDLSDL